MANFPYRVDRRLMLVPVMLHGKIGHMESSFVLDTGSSYNIIDPSLVDALGYSVRDAVGFSSVSSVMGKERGYRLLIRGLEALGKRFDNIEIACHDLKDQGIEGLIGMDFLERFRWCVDPRRQVIAVGE